VAIKLVDLLSRISPDVEGRVKRLRNEARSVVQDALRSECRLLMRTPEDSERNRTGAQVPIEVAPGYPVILDQFEFPEDLAQILLIARHRRDLEDVSSGVRGMRKLRQKLSIGPNPDAWIRATDEQLQANGDWAAFLLDILNKRDPLENLLSVSEDILGIYRYESSPYGDEFEANKAEIKIYWAVVGLVSELMGCKVEDLALVVLTHELAHAYTQLGADIDGRRWQAFEFSKSETSLKEGLAQYYTARVLNRIQGRYHGAKLVFEEMLPKQHEVYRAHLPWTDLSPESVRRAMLEVRRNTEHKLAQFNLRLKVAERELEGGEPSPSDA